MDTVIRRKMKNTAVSLGIFFIPKYILMCLPLGEAEADWGRKLADYPHTARNNLDPEVLYKLGASHRMMNIQWKTGGICYG